LFLSKENSECKLKFPFQCTKSFKKLDTYTAQPHIWLHPVIGNIFICKDVFSDAFFEINEGRVNVMCLQEGACI